jgi:hypothetical protein
MVLRAWTVPTRAERAAAGSVAGSVAVSMELPSGTAVRSTLVPSIPTQAGPRSPRTRPLACVPAPSSASGGPVPTPVRGERVLVPAGLICLSAPAPEEPGAAGMRNAVVGLPSAVRSDVLASDGRDARLPGAHLDGDCADRDASAPSPDTRSIEASPPGPQWPAVPWPDVPEPAFATRLSDDIELTRMSEPAERTVLRVPRVRLEFDTGERVDVVSDGAVGRDPAFTSGASAHHQVSIADPERSVSRLHLLFGPDGDAPNLWVTDAGSTNGTVLIDPSGSAMVLEPGVRAVVEPGWLIRFGGRSAAVVLAG